MTGYPEGYHSPMTRVVVIGGDAAGMSAAAQASRGRDPVELVVFERGEHTSYAACGLPYLVGGVVSDADRLVARTPAQHRANGIDVRTGHEVVALDCAMQEVEVRSVTGGPTTRHAYDHLVVATGAEPLRPPLPGVDAAGVFGLRTIPDATAILDVVRDRAPRHAVVVGAGYIGLEVAEALLHRGLDVTVLERLPQPMTTLDPDMAQRVADGMVGCGIDLRLGTAVEGFEVDGAGWVRAVAIERSEVPADLVVLGLGVRPRTALAEAAGIPIGPTGGIETDARMSTPVPGVWAAGDCAQSVHRVSGRPAAIALGTHANKQGRVVGINVSGGHARFPGYIGTAVTKVGPVEIGRTGLTEADAADAGFDPVGTTIEGTTRSHYYPDTAPIAVKVVADRGSGRLLGAQIVGGAEAAKRIDALAVAVWHEMTVDEVAMLDLGYAPPFSPVWDSILVAARKAGARIA